MEKINRLKRELVAKGKIFDYYQDTVQVANGNIAVWDYIHHKGAASVIPVREDGKILMVRQYRNALDRETLEIPAGGIEPGEPTDIAAMRECEEETGYRCDQVEFLISIRTSVGFCNEKIDIYVAKNLVPSRQNLDADEDINVEAYSVEEIIEKIYTAEIQDSKTISGIMAYVRKYNL